MFIRQFLTQTKWKTAIARALAPRLDVVRHHLGLSGERPAPQALARRTHAPISQIINTAWNRISRLLRRLDELMAKVEAGTARPPVKRKSRTATKPKTQSVRIPTGKSWAAIAPLSGSENFYIAQSLFAPEHFDRLIAEAPQSARIIRALCRLLQMPLPESLKLPKRPRKPRPKKPTPKKITKAELLETYPRPGVPRRWQLQIPGLNAPMLKRDREELRRLKKETKAKP